MKVERKQPVRIHIAAAGAEVKVNGSMDQKYRYLNALQLSMQEPENAFGSIISLRVSGQDVLETDTGAELLAVGIQTAPMDRLYPLCQSVPSANESFELRYKDAGILSSYPAEVKLYLVLSNESLESDQKVGGTE